MARYARQLSVALAGQEVELAPFAVGRGRRDAPPGVRHLGVPLRAVQRAWAVAGRPRVEGLVGPVDLVHSLDLRLPATGRPLVATVHDLAAIERPDLHPGRAVAQQRARLAGLGRARVVLADSGATAKALVARGVEAERIVVVPLGVSPLPPPVAAPVARPFLLAVGELAARKNLDCLLVAFAAARLGSVRLALAGPDGGQRDRLAALGRRLGLGRRLVMLGRVADDVLAGLYQDAVALCLPSLAEGFGLPVLEAMAAGLAVVASDLEVVREVAGEAALLVAPGDPSALADGLARVAGDEALRCRLARAGPRRASAFTWDETARATVQAYHRALACG